MGTLIERSSKPPEAPKPLSSHPMKMTAWPADRLPQGIGMSFKDGWNFGVGFGLAMTIAIPIILLIFGCIIGIGVVIMGGSLGALL